MQINHPAARLIEECVSAPAVHAGFAGRMEHLFCSDIWKAHGSSLSNMSGAWDLRSIEGAAGAGLDSCV